MLVNSRPGNDCRNTKTEATPFRPPHTKQTILHNKYITTGSSEITTGKTNKYITRIIENK